MSSLERIIRASLLTPLFQPVVDIGQRRIYGHEALIRGPADSALHMPEALFGAARREGLPVSARLELACAGASLGGYGESGAEGCLFINISAPVLLHWWQRWKEGLIERLLDRLPLPAGRLVVELTEQEGAAGALPALQDALQALRRAGMRVAIDDFGMGHSNLQLWAELQPDLVKVDRYFFAGIAHDEKRQGMVRAISSLAQCFGTPLVAEGIESADDLTMLWDLGIRYAQGWLLGRPQPDPASRVAEPVLGLLASQVARQPSGAGQDTARSLRILAPTVRQERHTNDDVHRLFLEQRELHAVAVLDEKDRPVGIINRRDFSERYAQRYVRELYGRHSCTTLMNAEPVLVDNRTSIAQLSHILVSEDQRYLVDGFIITRDDGRYDGLGTGEALVRSVTELRLEAARYANPLTSLPGNIPISQHIAALLAQEEPFVAGYADLNNFKPYNDVYGYWRGDDMIRLCAEVIRRHCDPRCDFVGHVGGDDFVILMRSHDWLARVREIIAEFDRRALDLYDDEGRRRGGIQAEDRYGVMRSFPFVTLGIGLLRIEPAALSHARAEDIASAAAQVKGRVKRSSEALIVEDYAPSMAAA